MAQTQEYPVSCGAGKVPARLPADRTRVAPGPPPSLPALADSAKAFRASLANLDVPALHAAPAMACQFHP